MPADESAAGSLGPTPRGGPSTCVAGILLVLTSVTLGGCGVGPGAAPNDAGATPDSSAPAMEAGTTQPVDGGPSGGPDSGGVPRITRILFDASHYNSVSNADWVVDHGGVRPTPDNPRSERDWSGGISAWGFDLYRSGRYEILQLPEGTDLGYGDGTPTDLAACDVFVSVEPERHFSPGELSALMEFATAGGGIFLVADHRGARRCDRCSEAWRVINTALSSAPLGDAFGVRCAGDDIGRDGATGRDTGATGLGAGPFGHAVSLAYHAGTSVSVTGTNPAAAVAVGSRYGGMLVVSSLPSGGRLVLLGDSSPADDGTCSGCGATLFDGWAEADDAAWILNATAWLAHDGG